MPKVEVSTRIEEGRRDAIAKDAKRRGTSVAEILRERIEAGEPIERMERMVEVLARTVGDLKGELKASINRLELQQEKAARDLARIHEEQSKHDKLLGAALRDVVRMTKTSADAMKGLLDAIKE